MTEEIKTDQFDTVEQQAVPDEYNAEYDNIVTNDWISNSALSLLMTCGFAFNYKYVLRIPEDRGIRSTAGSGGHKARETYLKAKEETEEGLPVDELTDAARDFVHHTFDKHPIHADSEFEGKGRTELRDITTDFAVNIAVKDSEDFLPYVKPKLVEHRMAVKFPGMSRTMVGMCDNIEVNDDIRDLKSGKRAYGQKKVDDLPGLTTYGIMRYAETGKLPGAYYVDNVTLLKNGPGSNAYVTHRTKEQLEQHLQRFIVWNKVIDSGLFGPADPGHWRCSESFCGYWSQCPFGKAKKGE